MIFKCDFV